MYARRLHGKFNFPGGLPEARLMLLKDTLTPCNPSKNSGNKLKPLPVHRVLRRAVPRFHRAVLDAASQGFIECVFRMIKVGRKETKGKKKGLWSMTTAEARRCLADMWWISDDVGREGLLAALCAALAKIHGLTGVMVEAAGAQRGYYKVQYSIHVAVGAKVSRGPSSSAHCFSLVGWIVSLRVLSCLAGPEMRRVTN